MEGEVTRLLRLTNDEVDVITLLRSITGKERAFILGLLKSQADAEKQQQPENVVRIGTR